MSQFLFSFAGFSMRSYGVIVALAILLGLGVSYSLATNERKYREYLIELSVYGTIGAIIGARLWQVFFYEWSYYSLHLAEILMIWHGGMAIQGSLIGAFIVGLIYARWHKLEFWRLADLAAPGLILGQAVGRFACFLNGDAFGSPTNVGYGLVYPQGTPAFTAYGNQPLWPAEVWEGQWDIIVFALVLMLSHWRKWPQGIIFLVYIALYSAGRFALEFLRGDGSRYLFNWTAAQWSSVVMILGALVMAIIILLRTRKVSSQTNNG